ncbi:MAG: hypothetical protein LBU95_00880 [Rikenellaceae bacterium]|jgi:alpha-glucosidase|nr:hypothetical protein [Rikenellaceae bacterium]
MNKKTVATLLITLLAAAHLHGAVSKITSEKGERWWGLFYRGAPMEPFAESFKTTTPGKSMLVSSLGRYIWCDAAAEITFDGEDFSIESSEVLEIQKGGRNLREAYLVCCHKHCPPDAAVAPDPEQFTVPYYETGLEFGQAHSAQTLLEYAARLRKEGFPAGVLVIGTGWSRMDGNFDFDPEYYPDPKAFVDGLHAMGFKVMLSASPRVWASGRAYAPLREGGSLVAGPDGEPVVASGHAGYTAYLDIRGEAVYETVREHLAALGTRYGVDGLRLQCAAAADYLPAAECEAFTGRWMALGEVLPMCQREPDPLEVHSAKVMCIDQGVFGGWASLPRALNDLLSGGLAGYANCLFYWHGADSPAYAQDELLVARTLQLCAMLPLCTVPYAPWRAGERYTEVKNTIARRMEINAYIREQLAESSRTAEPLVRNLEYGFPRSGFSDCTDQYMIGTRYLVAPILSPEGGMVRLPRGVWTDASGKRYKGPLVIPARPGGEPLVFELSK